METINKDIEFLQEMKGHVQELKKGTNTHSLEYLGQMVNDWLDELLKKKNNIESNVVSEYDTLQKIVDQLEIPDYITADNNHHIKNNVAFLSLKQKAQTEVPYPEIIKVLKDAKDTIKTWHGKQMWHIYDQQSPEMQTINNMIKRLQQACKES